MNSALSYSDSSDQELYLKTKIPIGDHNIKISAATIASEQKKPNEDAFAVSYQNTVLFAGIFDGTTSLKPIVSLGQQTGARFASHFLKKKFNQITIQDTPKELLLKLNHQLLNKSLQFVGTTLDDTHTLPSSTGTIIKIDMEKDILTFAQVGDSFCVVYFTDGTTQLITDDKNGKFDEKMFSLIKQIAHEKGITPRVARNDEQFKQALIAMFKAKNNNPTGLGTGVINGDPQIEKYIQTGKIELQDVKAILLGTDGLLPQGWSEQHEEDRQKLLTEIKKGGFPKLFKTKKHSEDADPDWKHIRYKHSDDATGILIELTARP